MPKAAENGPFPHNVLPPPLKLKISVQQLRRKKSSYTLEKAVYPQISQMDADFKISNSGLV